MPRTKAPHQAESSMRLLLRTDLGGRATELPALRALGDVEITEPLVLLIGGNGSGKSTLLRALRQATGLIGPRLGAFPSYQGFDAPIPFRTSWGDPKSEPDLARHLLLVSDRLRGWGRDEEAALPSNAVGILDPVALGWRGQRVFLHDGRAIDAMDSVRSGSFDITSMRRSADDRLRSHGEQMAGRLRYALGWACGLFDLLDAYDRKAPDKDERRHDIEGVPREVFRRLAGHEADSGTRNPERWLLLDEPETGLDPDVFARFLAILADQSAMGKLRVFCVTHSPLALAMQGAPGVQVIDLDRYGERLTDAQEMLADPSRRASVAAAELDLLRQDTAAGIDEDRGLQGQGRFTAHEAQSVPYAAAVKAPYGKTELLENMRGRSGAKAQPKSVPHSIEDED